MTLQLFTKEHATDPLPNMDTLNELRKLWLSQNEEVLKDAFLVANKLGLNVAMSAGRIVRVKVFGDFMIVAGQSDKGYIPSQSEYAVLNWVRVSTKDYPRDQWWKNRAIASCAWCNKPDELHPENYFCVPGTWCEEIIALGNQLRKNEAEGIQASLEIQKRELAKTLWLIDN